MNVSTNAYSIYRGPVKNIKLPKLDYTSKNSFTKLSDDLVNELKLYFDKMAVNGLIQPGDLRKNLIEISKKIFF